MQRIYLLVISTKLSAKRRLTKSLECENIPIYTVADPGEGPTHSLFLDQTEAQREWKMEFTAFDWIQISRKWNTSAAVEVQYR